LPIIGGKYEMGVQVFVLNFHNNKVNQVWGNYCYKCY